jgi:hypothetical protein
MTIELNRRFNPGVNNFMQVEETVRLMTAGPRAVVNAQRNISTASRHRWASPRLILSALAGNGDGGRLGDCAISS